MIISDGAEKWLIPYSCFIGEIIYLKMCMIKGVAAFISASLIAVLLLLSLNIACETSFTIIYIQMPFLMDLVSVRL